METPNLLYIEKLTNGNMSSKLKIITILKEEFLIDKIKYFECLKAKDYFNLKIYMHRIKNKMAILGYEKQYTIVNNIENKLPVYDSKEKKLFEDILFQINKFLNNI